MQAHVAYCGELLRAGKALVFGPVADPAGAWGLGVLQLPDDADPQDIIGQRSRREGRCRLHLPGDAAGSHNSRKAKARLGRLHARIANIRPAAHIKIFDADFRVGPGQCVVSLWVADAAEEQLFKPKPTVDKT